MEKPFDTIPTTAEKMAGTTIFSGGSADALSDFIIIRWIICLFVSEKHFLNLGGIAGCRGKFFIGSRLFMANQTIHLCLIRKVELIVFPAISGVTRCATSLVALDVDSEIVDGQPAFAELQVGLGGGVHPSPVNGFVKLGRGFGMAAQAGFGDLWSGFEILF